MNNYIDLVCSYDEKSFNCFQKYVYMVENAIKL